MEGEGGGDGMHIEPQPSEVGARAEDVVVEDDHSHNPFGGVGLPALGIFEMEEPPTEGGLDEFDYGDDLAVQDADEGGQQNLNLPVNSSNNKDSNQLQYAAEENAKMLVSSEPVPQNSHQWEGNDGPASAEDHTTVDQGHVDWNQNESWSEQEILLYPTQFPQIQEGSRMLTDMSEGPAERLPGSVTTGPSKGGTSDTNVTTSYVETTSITDPAPNAKAANTMDSKLNSGKFEATVEANGATGNGNIQIQSPASRKRPKPPVNGKQASPNMAARSHSNNFSNLSSQQQTVQDGEVSSTAAKRPRTKAVATNESKPSDLSSSQPLQQDMKKAESKTDSVATADQKEKKQRLVWTPELHDRFLQSIKTLGIQNAVPKTVLQFMNVPHLTTEHVKSHLQKYRNNLKKEAAQEARKPVMGPVNVVSRQSVSMHPFPHAQVQGMPQGYAPGATTPGGNDFVQRHLEWHIEILDKTMRFMLQMQMNHHHLVTVQRKAHLNLERQSRLANQPHARPNYEDLLKEYETLVAEQSSMHGELNRQQALLRDLISEQDQMRQRFLEGTGLMQMPMPQ